MSKEDKPSEGNSTPEIGSQPLSFGQGFCNAAENLSEQSIQALLSRFAIHLQRGTLSHALLFYGADIQSSNAFLDYLSAMLLCHDAHNKPCFQCQSCQLIANNGHPDRVIVQPEKKTGPIKIESIREIGQVSYLSPQLGFNRVILIRCAEKMNAASSNALLKLLEEPPNGVYFILQALHLNNFLPTVLSRCQRWQLPGVRDNYQTFTDFLTTAPLSVEDPDVAAVRQKLPEILQDLSVVLVQKKQSCAIAAKWLEYDLLALVNVLYWINATLIQQLLGAVLVKELVVFQPHVTVHRLFYQLDKLNQTTRLLNQSIAINALLTLEDFLLGYASHDRM
jgi:DNA polymerase-3 subunit delta'